MKGYHPAGSTFGRAAIFPPRNSLVKIGPMDSLQLQCFEAAWAYQNSSVLGDSSPKMVIEKKMEIEKSPLLIGESATISWCFPRNWWHKKSNREKKGKGQQKRHDEPRKTTFFTVQTWKRLRLGISLFPNSGWKTPLASIVAGHGRICRQLFSKSSNLPLGSSWFLPKLVGTSNETNPGPEMNKRTSSGRNKSQIKNKKKNAMEKIKLSRICDGKSKKKKHPKSYLGLLIMENNKSP